MGEKITLWDWFEHDDGLHHMSATKFGRWCEWKDAKAIIDRQAAVIRDLRAESKWRPMTEAPRDGTEVLLQVEIRAGIPGKCLVGHWMPGGYCIDDHPPIDSGWYFWNGCMFDKASRPVAWASLPAQEKNNEAGEDSDE